MESIVAQTIPQLNPGAQTDKMDNDWIINFFDKCRLVSDIQVQAAWSRILAGEANTPGSFSKRTVSLLASLDKNDTLLFTNLCSFNWLIGNELFPLVYDSSKAIYKNKGITFSILLLYEIMNTLFASFGRHQEIYYMASVVFARLFLETLTVLDREIYVPLSSFLVAQF
jgi:hypothetical protein